MTDFFLYLPSRKVAFIYPSSFDCSIFRFLFQLYPDYYLVVTNPIDLKMIAMKIENQEYSTLDDMENDLLLMVSNAKKYNDPKSEIYKVTRERERRISTHTKTSLSGCKCLEKTDCHCS